MDAALNPAFLSTTQQIHERVMLQLNESFFGSISIDQFQSQYLSKEFLFVKGDSDKFKDTFDWLDLNRILEGHRLNYPRLRLIDKGNEINAEQYIRKTTLKDGLQLHHPNVEAIRSNLKSGATLVLDSVNELHPHIQLLCDFVESISYEKLQANLYLCFSDESYGFDIHWDTHDVLILQLEGSKKWSIFAGNGNTDPKVNGQAVPGDLIWSETLQKGDVLYMPKGTWHLAEPQGETLHFTLGFTNRTGLDVFKWLQSGLSGTAVMKADFPKFGTAEDLKRWRQAFDDAVCSGLDALDAQDYLLEMRKSSRFAERFNLPFGLTCASNPVMLLKDAIFQWAAIRQLKAGTEMIDGDVVITTSSKKIRMDATALPLINILKQHLLVSYQDFTIQAMREGWEEEELAHFCLSLLNEQIITIVRH